MEFLIIFLKSWMNKLSTFRHFVKAYRVKNATNCPFRIKNLQFKVFLSIGKLRIDFINKKQILASL